jgi:hypothetical protein
MESQPRALMRASCLIAASAGAAATPTIGLMADSSNSTHSGPVEFKPWYRFGTRRTSRRRHPSLSAGRAGTISGRPLDGGAGNSQ